MPIFKQEYKEFWCWESYSRKVSIWIVGKHTVLKHVNVAWKSMHQKPEKWFAHTQTIVLLPDYPLLAIWQNPMQTNECSSRAHFTQLNSPKEHTIVVMLFFQINSLTYWTWSHSDTYNLSNWNTCILQGKGHSHFLKITFKLNWSISINV